MTNVSNTCYCYHNNRENLTKPEDVESNDGRVVAKKWCYSDYAYKFTIIVLYWLLRRCITTRD